MKPKIATLSIERFRALRQLKIDGFGRVNLITGRNNTGKSSVLEALRLLASDASPSVILNILRFREEDVGEPEENSRALDAEGVFLLSSLFNGFPQFSAKLESIVIAANGGSRPMRLTMEAGWLSEERDQDGTRKMVPKQEELFDAGDAIPALAIVLLSFLPLTTETRQVLLVIAVQPTAMVSVTMAEIYHADTRFAAAAVLTTHLVCLASIPIWLHCLL